MGDPVMVPGKGFGMAETVKKLKRICLVHPAGSNWFPGYRDFTPIANRLPPVGILSIAACLEARGHIVHVIDCLGPEPPENIDAAVRDILAFQPDFAGFSTTTSSFPDAAEMVEKLKQSEPRIITVNGGPHGSALKESLLKSCPAMDCVVYGEGEPAMIELVESASPGTTSGTVWRAADGAITVNPPRTDAQDLDALPWPAYHLLKHFPKKYNLPMFGYVNSPGTSMITSRGCPYQCSYCDRSVFGKSYRYNSADYVYEHMKYMATRFGVRHIIIQDDLFTTHRKRVMEICHRLIEEPLGIQFNCVVRVQHTDPELLKLLKKAGCLQVSLGIESGDPDQIKIHKGDVTLEQVQDTVAQIREAGLRVKGLFIIGLPGDTEASIRRTGDFAISLDLDNLNYAKFTPFPGAPVWDSIHEQGTFHEDWRKMNCLNFVFLPGDIASFDTLESLYNEQVKRFYRSKPFRKRFIKNIWQHRDSLKRFLVHLPAFLQAGRRFSK